MHSIHGLVSLVSQHQVLAHAVIFIGIVFEGEFFVISTGIMAHLGALNFWAALIFIFLGGLGKTFLGYQIGLLIGRKWQNTKILKYIEKRVQYYLPHFRRKPFWSIFLSKFIIGANHIVIIFSGILKIDYKKYLKAEIISTTIWAPGLLSLGYFFSYTAFHISREIWRFSSIILVFVVIFIVLDRVFGWLYQLFEEIYGSKQDN
ncbi:MAG: DedA family protein [Patescibacteria group bacterium]